jgi:hypothetical protein
MTIYLTPSNQPLSVLLSDLRKRLQCLRLNMIDEDLTAVTPYTVYQAEHRQWETFPKPRVRRIDVEGFESTLVEGTDFTIDYANGRITLTLPLLHLATADDSIRVDYTFDVFSDAQLIDFLTQSAREIKVAIQRNLDTSNIAEDYKEAILKKAFTNAFKCLIEQTFHFFNVTVMGRTVDKAMLVDTIQKIITTNEELLEKEINSLRNFNQTNRME